MKAYIFQFHLHFLYVCTTLWWNDLCLDQVHIFKHIFKVKFFLYSQYSAENQEKLGLVDVPLKTFLFIFVSFVWRFP